MNINFTEHKNIHKETSLGGGVSIFNSAWWVWVLLSLWLAYNVAMLWHFKEQAYWKASVCKVAT